MGIGIFFSKAFTRTKASLLPSVQQSNTLPVVYSIHPIAYIIPERRTDIINLFFLYKRSHNPDPLLSALHEVFFVQAFSPYLPDDIREMIISKLDFLIGIRRKQRAYEYSCRMGKTS